MAAALDTLKTAFTLSLGIDPKTEFDQLAYGITAGWDSVAHMSLISEIESAFDIMLTTDDVIGMSSFPKAMEIVSRHGIRF
jgi:acyl carrier protein